MVAEVTTYLFVSVITGVFVSPCNSPFAMAVVIRIILLPARK